MGKLFAVVVTLIALASAAIFALHIWWVPPDISTHGSRIDRQLNETMIVAGVLFVGAQLALAFFVWRFSASGTARPTKSFPGGPTPMVVLATVLVGAEILVMPANQPVELRMHAKDVNHSFYVPELRIQQDIVPGLVIPLHFTATKPGKYELVCTQLCGLGHYNMRAFVEVKTRVDFDQWLKEK